MERVGGEGEEKAQGSGFQILRFQSCQVWGEGFGEGTNLWELNRIKSSVTFAEASCCHPWLGMPGPSSFLSRERGRRPCESGGRTESN